MPPFSPRGPRPSADAMPSGPWPSPQVPSQGSVPGRWWSRLWVIVVAVLLLPPVGIWLLWFHRGPANPRRVLGTVTAALWALAWFGAAVSSPSSPPVAAHAPMTAATSPIAPSVGGSSAAGSSAGGSSPGVAGSSIAPAASAPAVPASATSTLLAMLPVKGRAPMTGYNRGDFGPAWSDVDRNGCDTRNDVLRRDLTGIAIKAGSNSCVVTSGMLLDPYSGTVIQFAAGSGIQIDHVVSLGDAWQTGAQTLDTTTRTDLANDPLNLLAVQGRLNQQKSDSDAASWLPPNKAFRCTYVTRQIQVKAKYHLWVTAAERTTMVATLTTCSDTPPTPVAPSAAQLPASAPAPAPASEPATTVAPPPASAEVYYGNCTAARNAGAAPLLRGQPGYRAALDRDDDGIACE